LAKNLRKDILGAAAVLVAMLSFGCTLYVVVRGAFTPFLLLAAAVAVLTMAVVVVGLATVQRPGLASIGLAGALTFAAGSLFLLFVVLFALVAGVNDPDALSSKLGSVVPAAQASLVPGGLAFAAASYARGRFPRWSCACFGLGLVLLIMTLDGPAEFVLAGEGLRALGLVGMGFSLLPNPRLRPRSMATGT
jgi:hypothetical protein